MSWTYRVVRYPETLYEDEWCAIEEVYDGGGRGEAAPIGDTPGELKSTLTLMLAAFDKPVLTVGEDIA